MSHIAAVRRTTTLLAWSAAVILAISGCTIRWSGSERESTPRPNPTVLEIVYGTHQNGQIAMEFTLENLGDGPLEWIEVSADFAPRKEVTKQLPPRRWNNYQAPMRQGFDPPLLRGDQTKVKVYVAAPDLVSFLRENYLLLADITGGLCIFHNDMPLGDSGGTLMPVPECLENIRVVTSEEYRRISPP